MYFPILITTVKRHTVPKAKKHLELNPFNMKAFANCVQVFYMKSSDIWPVHMDCVCFLGVFWLVEPQDA